MDNVREKLVELLDTNCGYVDEVEAKVLADYLIANNVTVLPESVWVVYPIQHVVAHSPRLRTVYVLKRIPIQDLSGLLSAQRMYERLFETKEDAELYKCYLERSSKE